MSCSQCCGIEIEFDERTARRDLEVYQKRGPAKTTRWLLDELKGRTAAGHSLLDIGGGVGAIQHEMLEAGLEGAVHVDASQAYLKVSRTEAVRRGHDARVTYHHGDFIALAGELQQADIVTLDRVICCYDDMRALVSLSAAKARQLYGVVYPRDTWWLRLSARVFNAIYGLLGRAFRIFIHPSREVEKLLALGGWEQACRRTDLLWQVVVYVRRPAGG